MSLYAELDSDNRVLRVVVGDSLEWLQTRLGGTWVETGPTTAQQQGAGPGLYESDVAPRRFVPAWTQPQGAHDAYPSGRWVWRAGQVWENLIDANVWEPGVSGWRDPLNAWPEWVQPSGAHDAYSTGAKVTFNSQHYTSVIDANVWSPAAYPAGWVSE